ncbi:hypothetical protein THAOC_15074, partial [Thalassiosira oceanica]
RAPEGERPRPPEGWTRERLYWSRRPSPGEGSLPGGAVPRRDGRGGDGRASPKGERRSPPEAGRRGDTRPPRAPAAAASMPGVFSSSRPARRGLRAPQHTIPGVLPRHRRKREPPARTSSKTTPHRGVAHHRAIGAGCKGRDAVLRQQSESGGRATPSGRGASRRSSIERHM